MNRATSDRRLLKLADFLAELPRKRFDFDMWVGRDWKGAKDLSCGTTACALGWAASMPEFRRLGLELAQDSWGEPGDLGGYVRLRKTGWEGEQAAAEVFGVTEDEAYYIFNPGADGDLPPFDLPLAPYSTATPKQVAAHIRRFVKARANAA